MKYRLGVDIGGTFTDIVLLGESGAVETKKILSTPDDYSRAIEDGIRGLLAETGINPADIAEVAHGTTVATNAIIERKGVRVALVTTEGFRDVLEIARYRAPRLYDVFFRKPEPLVERRLRFQVPERIAASGEIVTPLDRDAVLAVAEKCVAAEVDAVAICFINAYANGAHEEQAAALFRQRYPELPVTVSSELVPQIQEYERTSTTVVNAYIRPVIERYARRLDDRLKTIGITVPLNIMQSNGGVLPGELAARKPIFIIESGPAAGVVGAKRLGDRIGLGDAIVFDMGGTTAKAAIIVGGDYGMAPETEVGGGAALGHRMIRGGGYVVQAPTIDIAEVGAGGGSIAWIDAGGGIQVGPHSAGAAPGPVCYGRGGTEPTVTDANLLLGYLNPDVLVGGDLKLDRDAAESAVAAIGGKLGQDTTAAAYGIHLIANARMMRALSAVSSERGLDPASFGIFAFGGNGGVHVCGLATALGIERVVVPPAAGLFSALGLIFADVEHQCIRAYYRPIDSLDLDDLNRTFGALRDEAAALLTADGYSDARQELTYSAEVKYIGQNTALAVPVRGLPIGRADLSDISESFSLAHQNVFGYRSDEERLQLAALKAVGRGVPDAPRLPDAIKLGDGFRPKGGSRKAYFGEDHGWLDTPVTGRAALGRKPRPGPLIVEEYDSTTVVRPGWTACLDGWNNIVLMRG
ncbi:MAG: hydantoinase/oxoprolinase family protein [Alphaproteobacteria bacterium]|nr:hydantoinase/oxoprolinase family protein [Alphaproteobacteria bacterium]